MAILVPRPRSQAKFPTMNNTLTTGVTKATSPQSPIVSAWHQRGNLDLHTYRTYVETQTLQISVTNASLGAGEHIFTFPLGRIQPISAYVEFTCTNISGTTGTGEVGLGTTIASGAVTTLGGTVAFGDIMDGTTIADLTTASSDTFFKSNKPDLTGTLPTDGVIVFDGSATAKKCHLNFAHDFDASEVFTFSAKITVDWKWMGAGV